MIPPFNQRLISKLILIFSGLALFGYSQAQAVPHNANHLISGIMSYTTWESSQDQINFCKIDGSPKFISANIFNPTSPLIQPSNVKILNLESNELTSDPPSINNYHCDVLYFVNTDDHLQQKIISQTTSRHLSISENNPECTIGSSFCLYYRNQRFSFQVNLNSLKRSKIRVNSKVLMLSQSGGETE